MADRCDVVIVGAGAMGSAAAWWLARRGRDVITVEQFEAGHQRGSSHGGSRIFRMAYPDPDYVRLALAAQPLWAELSAEAGEDLLLTTGGVDHGQPEAVEAVARALASCGVAYELLAPEAAVERWPGLRFTGPVCFQPDAGCARADATVSALQRLAVASGARMLWNDAVEQIEPVGGGVALRSGTATIRAEVAVVAAGAWSARLLGAAARLPPLTVTQEQVFHFRRRRGRPPSPWPAFIHHRSPVIYGLETPDDGVKVAEHHAGTVLVDPDVRTFRADPAARRRVRDYVEEWLPGLEPEPASDTTCLYATTPTEDFVIDRHGPLVVAAGFSGHGFKFTPVIGRMLADLADGKTAPAGRFALPA